jgi:hypothetical protein
MRKSTFQLWMVGIWMMTCTLCWGWVILHSFWINDSYGRTTIVIQSWSRQVRRLEAGQRSLQRAVASSTEASRQAHAYLRHRLPKQPLWKPSP